MAAAAAAPAAAAAAARRQSAAGYVPPSENGFYRGKCFVGKMFNSQSYLNLLLMLLAANVGNL